MFPLCEECWKESPPPIRYDYCKKLVSEIWLKEPEDIDWNIVAKECGVNKK
jgi:hypothetical protein